MRVLESERLLLRPVEKEDLEFLLELRWDREITAHLVHQPISMRSQLVWFEDLQKTGELALCILLKDGESEGWTRAGVTGLSHFNARHQRAVWQSCRVAKAWQRRGIAFEACTMLFDYAFSTLNLQKLTGDAFVGNTAIREMSKKLGFVEEGVLHRHYFHDGEFRDVVCLGLQREDYLSRDRRESRREVPGTSDTSPA